MHVPWPFNNEHLALSFLYPRPHNHHAFFFFFKTTPAEPVTFLWIFTYPLSVYPPLVLPAILAFIVTTVETIGDVTTTAEVSKLPVEGHEHFQVYSSSSSSGDPSVHRAGWAVPVCPLGCLWNQTTATVAGWSSGARFKLHVRWLRTGGGMGEGNGRGERSGRGTRRIMRRTRVNDRRRDRGKRKKKGRRRIHSPVW